MSDSHGRLNDRTAIITGASRGIGRATALLFAGEGASVVVADVNTDDGTEIVDRIEADGGTASFVSVDVTDSEQVQAMIDHAVKMYGGVDILVNNAGITKDATLKKMTEEAFDQVVDVNLKGVFNCTKAALPALTDSEHGRVLNAASVVGLYGNFGQTNYVATKSGVIGMTKTWARELGRDRVTVNAVAPGFIETPMVDTVPDKVLEQLKGRTPLGRLGTAEDIANAYLFLASEEASFITGAVLSVDGGLVL
ncbi:3-oxoacyl-ACP reductase FabG [Longibacter sp.]|uniref:3-oxoacyl-ACP reductase FabG n=1 Tax=Longibacter sp. TaxID=2045415 RepID=UPI003EBC35AD